MMRGGTKIFCPECKENQVCRAISPTALNEPSAQRVQDDRHTDLNWFRRGRECLHCGHQFLTGELDEAFIRELVSLREAWLAKIKAAALKAGRRANKQSRLETVSYEDAHAFMVASAKWDHPSYQIVDAPKHADRIYEHALGWAVDYGANTFLPGMAVARCNREMAHIFERLAQGHVVFRSEVLRRLITVISGCVATQDGFEYNGYYPMDGVYLTFGTQLIDADDGAQFMLRKADPDSIIL